MYLPIPLWISFKPIFYVLLSFSFFLHYARGRGFFFFFFPLKKSFTAWAIYRDLLGHGWNWFEGLFGLSYQWCFNHPHRYVGQCKYSPCNNRSFICNSNSSIESKKNLKFFDQYSQKLNQIIMLFIISMSA